MARLTLKNYFIETHLFTHRVITALVLVLLLMLVLIARLAYLQIDQHQFYSTLSAENQMNLIPVDPNRGLIYDRNGVLLAENIPVYSLDVNPELVPHFSAALAALQQLIDITPEDIAQYRKALRQRRSSEGVPLKFNLSEEEVASFYLNQYRFPGFQITGRLMRHYPHGENMVSALGYVGRINEEELANVDPTNYAATNYIGKLGIEKYYEARLHGTVGYKQVETDANGRVVRTMKYTPPVSGDSLYLTIDSKLQQAAEDALGDDEGAVVAINPKTGEVLAFVSNPRYDPNLFVKGISARDYKALQQDPLRPLYNRALRGLYAPGSTIKPFLAVQVLNIPVAKPTDTISDNGFFYLPGVHRAWRDWNWEHGGHGIVNLRRAIVESCDVYFYNMGVRMGIGRLNDIQYRFGLGKPTGLDVDEELGGVVPSPAWKKTALKQGWYGGDTVNAAIGQGFTLVTPLQMASAVATMANRGVGYQPRFLLKWQAQDGKVEVAKPIAKPPVVVNDPKIWDLVIAAMQGVVTDPRGTAHKLSVNTPYSIAGKTGTAQVFRPKEYGDKDRESLPKKYRSNAWFISFAPVENPQIAVAALVEHHPHQGSVVAKRVLDYYLLPDHGQSEGQIEAESGPSD